MTRFVYFDEAGVGSLSADPHLVVAGVMVKVDTQWLGLESYLREMLEDCVPHGEPTPPFFHAKDVYHGTKAFHRDKWPSKNRRALLAEMSRVPRLWDLPLFGVALNRAEQAEKYARHSALERDIQCYTLAAAISLMQVERYMRQQGDPGEVAAGFFENNDRLRAKLKGVHQEFRKPSKTLLAHSLAAEYVPFTRIVDTVSFQEKTDASILQVADFCAFAKKRAAAGQSNADWLYHPIQSNFVMLPHDELKELYTREPLQP